MSSATDLGIVDWESFIDQIEHDVAMMEAALAVDGGELPELGPLAPLDDSCVPEELRGRAEQVLRTVFELEQLIATRLEMVARQLSCEPGRAHQLAPSYGGLDVDC